MDAATEDVTTLLSEYPVADTDAGSFLEHQFDLGIAWVHFRPGHGGCGLPPSVQADVDRQLSAAGAPVAFHLNTIGVGMIAPTIHDHGSAEQCEKWLRPLFSGREIWCQMFSEPGAGSDLAGVATSATRDGDTWVLNGQKVWTSFAHVARWGFVLARTDSEQPKHRGLTCFAVDMNADGVEVRPLYQMTGDAEFNEVYLTDVQVPDRHRIGNLGEGWRVALTTLMNERVAIGGRPPQRGEGPIAEVLAAWAEVPDRSSGRRDVLMKLWSRAEALRLMSIGLQQTRSQLGPGPEGSLAKLMSAELNKDVYAFALELLGPYGLLYPGGYPLARSNHSPFERGRPQHDFLRAVANSIEGGTSEIARNILGERMLGLPGEPRTDNSLPWSQVLRS